MDQLVYIDLLDCKVPTCSRPTPHFASGLEQQKGVGGVGEAIK
jgi:hypothetical protein